MWNIKSPCVYYCVYCAYYVKVCVPVGRCGLTGIGLHTDHQGVGSYY